MRNMAGILFVLAGAALIGWATLAAGGWVAILLAAAGVVVVLIGTGFGLASRRGLVDREGAPPAQTPGRPGPGSVEQQN